MEKNKLFSFAVMFLMVAAVFLAAVPGSFAEDAAAGEGAADADDGADDGSETEEENELDTEDLTDVKFSEDTVDNGGGIFTQVKIADGIDEDGNAVHLEMRTTDLKDGRTLVIEIEKETAEDGSFEEEMSVTLTTPYGEFEIEVENETDENGNLTTEIETEIESEDDVPLTLEKVQQMIDQTKSIQKYFPEINESITSVVNVLAGTDGSLEITPEVFAKLAEDDEMEFEITTTDGIVSLDSEVCGSMSGLNEQVTVTMKQNDRTGLTQEQLDTIGNNKFVTLDAETLDGEKIHDLNGNANITLTDPGLADKKVVYVDEQGNTEDVTTDTVAGQLTFTTTHFSVFMVVDDNGNPDPDNTLIIAGAAAVLIIAVLAMVLLKRR